MGEGVLFAEMEQTEEVAFLQMSSVQLWVCGILTPIWYLSKDDII